MRSRLLVTLLAGTVGACSTDALPSPADVDAAVLPDLAIPPPDLTPPPPPDLMFALTPHPPAPQIPDNGGPKLVHPAVVTITWKDDPLEAQLQEFDRWLVGSKYFTGSLAEYGISAGTDEDVVLPDKLPPTVDDEDIRALLKASIESMALPPVTPDRLYVVYPPDGIAVTYDYGGMITYRSCTQFTAYHSVGPATASGDIIYVVVPRCHFQGFADIDYNSWGASERIVEAVTDPTGKGWFARSMDLLFINGGEVTGPCAGQDRTVEGHLVNAIYSNAAAARNERYCVPAPPGPAFGATAMPDTLQIAAGDTGHTSVLVWSSAPLPRPLRFDVYPFPMGQLSARAGSLL